jgi:hypothetical protein
MAIHLTTTERRIAEAYAGVLDYVSRLALAVEHGDWFYLADKAAELERHASNLHQAAQDGHTATTPPRQAVVRAWVAQRSSRAGFRAGELLHPVERHAQRHAETALEIAKALGDIGDRGQHQGAAAAEATPPVPMTSLYVAYSISRGRRPDGWWLSVTAAGQQHDHGPFADEDTAIAATQELLRALEGGPFEREPVSGFLHPGQRRELWDVALAGVELGAYDRRILDWMARNLDTPTTLVVVGLLRRARAAVQAYTTDLSGD